MNRRRLFKVLALLPLLGPSLAKRLSAETPALDVTRRFGVTRSSWRIACEVGAGLRRGEPQFMSTWLADIIEKYIADIDFTRTDFEGRTILRPK